MHVAIVTETYPPDINGVALTVRELERGLAARGHRVHTVRPRPAREGDGGPADLLVDAWPVPRYPGLRMGRPCALRLRRHWRNARPDAVYIATEGPLGMSALWAARALGIPVATGFHTRFDTYLRDYGVGLLAGVARAWMRGFHARGQATLVPTRALADELVADGYRHVVQLARAVDTRLFHPGRRDESLRAEWGANAGTPVLLHLGRLAPEKNLPLAVRAFEAALAARPDARVVWVGDGPAREALQAAHPHHVFCGMRRGEDLARHVASADVFVFPSRSETFGNVTLEALASGVATIAFDTGAAHEVLRDGVHGACLADGDGDALVAATVRIAADDALRASLRSNARGAVAHLDPARVAADFEAILARLARLPASTGRVPRPCLEGGAP